MSRGLFEAAIRAEGLNDTQANLAFSIFGQESGAGRNTQTSNRGAVGAMQIRPGTFNEVADPGWDINNPEHNMRAGLRYLQKMSKLAGGDPRLAAIGYYSGPGGMEKARRGVPVSDPKNPSYPNTFQYADQVMGRMGKGRVGPPGGVVYAQGGAGEPAPSAPPQAPAAASAAPGSSGSPPGPVPLPKELVEYLANRSTALGGQSQEQANAWLSFIKAMPQAQPQLPPGVAPMEEPMSLAQAMDYAGALRSTNTPTGRVDFTPFGGLGRSMKRRIA